MGQFRRSLENYIGPVEILSETGQLVVTARANYEVEERAPTGMKDWHGVLTRIDPSFCMEPAKYRLRRPDGTEGEILVTNVRISTNVPETVRFAGSGPAPGF